MIVQQELGPEFFRSKSMSIRNFLHIHQFFVGCFETEFSVSYTYIYIYIYNHLSVNLYFQCIFSLSSGNNRSRSEARLGLCFTGMCHFNSVGGGGQHQRSTTSLPPDRTTTPPLDRTTTSPPPDRTITSPRQDTPLDRTPTLPEQDTHTP